MNALRLRTQTQLTQLCAITHARTQIRFLSLREKQLAYRKQLQQQRHKEEEKEVELQPVIATDIPEQRFAVTKYNAGAVNAGSIKIPPLDVAQSGQTRDFKWSIQGQENQIVEITLNPNSSVVAETGNMLEIADGVDMNTRGGQQGGAIQSFSSMFSKQGVSLTEFVNNRPAAGRTVFSSPYPSKVLAIDLQALGGALICQKSSFLVGSNTINIDVAFSKNFTSGYFGGEGFILQQLHGEGTAFVQAGGAVIKRTLAPGETIKVSTGSLVAFQPSIEYDVQLIRGVKTTVFGGEGVFMATLKGPGLVILQSLPVDRLVGAITSRSNPNAAAVAASGYQNRQLAQQTGTASAVGPAQSGGFGSGLGGAVAGGLAAGVAAGAISSMLGGHGGGNNNAPASDSTPPPPSSDADPSSSQVDDGSYGGDESGGGGWGSGSDDDGGGWGGGDDFGGDD